MLAQENNSSKGTPGEAAESICVPRRPRGSPLRAIRGDGHSLSCCSVEREKFGKKQRGFRCYLHGIACLRRALVPHCTDETGHVLENWEQASRGNASALADYKWYIISQTTSSKFCLPAEKEFVGFAAQLARAGGDRGQSVPQGIPGVGRRKSICSSMRPHSQRRKQAGFGGV